MKRAISHIEWALSIVLFVSSAILSVQLFDHFIVQKKLQESYQKNYDYLFKQIYEHYLSNIYLLNISVSLSTPHVNYFCSSSNEFRGDLCEEVPVVIPGFALDKIISSKYLHGILIGGNGKGLVEPNGLFLLANFSNLRNIVYNTFRVVIYNPNNYDLIDYPVRVVLPVKSYVSKVVNDYTGKSLDFCYEHSNFVCDEDRDKVIWVKVDEIPKESNITIEISFSESSDDNAASTGYDVFPAYLDFPLVLGSTQEDYLNQRSWKVNNCDFDFSYSLGIILRNPAWKIYPDSSSCTLYKTFTGNPNYKYLLYVATRGASNTYASFLRDSTSLSGTQLSKKDFPYIASQASSTSSPNKIEIKVYNGGYLIIEHLVVIPKPKSGRDVVIYYPKATSNYTFLLSDKLSVSNNALTTLSSITGRYLKVVINQNGKVSILNTDNTVEFLKNALILDNARGKPFSNDITQYFYDVTNEKMIVLFKDSNLTIFLSKGPKVLINISYNQIPAVMLPFDLVSMANGFDYWGNYTNKVATWYSFSYFYRLFATSDLGNNLLKKEYGSYHHIMLSNSLKDFVYIYFIGQKYNSRLEYLKAYRHTLFVNTPSYGIRSIEKKKAIYIPDLENSCMSGLNYVVIGRSKNGSLIKRQFCGDTSNKQLVESRTYPNVLFYNETGLYLGSLTIELYE